MKNHISVICKKEDFETSNYYSMDCALARALKRAGYSGTVGGMVARLGPAGSVDYCIAEWDEIIYAYHNPRDLQVNLLLI